MVAADREQPLARSVHRSGRRPDRRAHVEHLADDRVAARALRLALEAQAQARVTFFVAPAGDADVVERRIGGRRAGLVVGVLFAGAAESEVLVRPFGNLFVSLASPWKVLPWGEVSDPPVVVKIPPGLPTPLLVYLQELALDPAKAGNFSNPVEVVIR